MARTDNLHNYLTDVAIAIKNKKGDTTPIKASDFDTEIENLPSGGGDDLSEYFVTEINQNTSTSFRWDGFKKIADVKIADNVTSLTYLFRNYTFFGQSYVNEFPKIICGPNVTSMYYMYASSSTSSNSPSKIDITGLDTSNVTTMERMFNGRSNLLSLDFSNFDFKNVTTLSGMFTNCSSLTEIDMQNLIGKTSDNFSTQAMFAMCLKIKKINLRNLVGVSNCSQMFNNCYLLEEIYLDSLERVPDYSGYINLMFQNCGRDLSNGQLTKVYVKDAEMQNWVLTASNGHPSTWTTDNVIIAGSEQDLRN